MNKKQYKCNYLYSEEFKTSGEKITEANLKKIFNEKFFKTIIKIEKFTFERL